VPAYVGFYAARLEMPWVRSLKEKRALVRPGPGVDTPEDLVRVRELLEPGP